jgi:hypothetical protein
MGSGHFGVSPNTREMTWFLAQFKCRQQPGYFRVAGLLFFGTTAILARLARFRPQLRMSFLGRTAASKHDGS